MNPIIKPLKAKYMLQIVYIYARLSFLKVYNMYAPVA